VELSLREEDFGRLIEREPLPKSWRLWNTSDLVM
jgi:hypothetical protein